MDYDPGPRPESLASPKPGKRWKKHVTIVRVVTGNSSTLVTLGSTGIAGSSTERSSMDLNQMGLFDSQVLFYRHRTPHNL